MKHLTNNLLNLVQVQCCICGSNNIQHAGSGEDYEYDCSADIFSAVQCNTCGLVYLNPRPSVSEFEKIYPKNYHAFDFSEEEFGFVHKIRSWLEAKRLLVFCEEVPTNGKILDVGCGDGFHLNLLRKYGEKSWTVEGIDMDKRAIEMAEKSGLVVHQGSVESIDLPANTYDLAFTIQTIEHVEKPDEVLKGIYKLLKPGGRLVIVTDNTDSLDFKFFKKRYWGGYHFPRHWNLFNKNSLSKLAQKTGFEVDLITTQVSPVNWVYTIHNWLVDKNAPGWLIKRFTLKSTVSLAAFTLLDIVLQKFKKGALLRAFLKKPV
jgi:2-polyprenyl-3-methyl-5-hydroxy-6-metoxy-1,4-benzoquinol methylase